mmetsp:Transcript_135221/g.432245  ORF Transcript_135221/g.432245 Transcript_135221/m.432245 type:complete len:238 (-) Transcript_135221:1743-2456(-)
MVRKAILVRVQQLEDVRLPLRVRTKGRFQFAHGHIRFAVAVHVETTCLELIGEFAHGNLAIVVGIEPLEGVMRLLGGERRVKLVAILHKFLFGQMLVPIAVQLQKVGRRCVFEQSSASGGLVRRLQSFFELLHGQLLACCLLQLFRSGEELPSADDVEEFDTGDRPVVVGVHARGHIIGHICRQSRLEMRCTLTELGKRDAFVRVCVASDESILRGVERCAHPGHELLHGDGHGHLG